MLFCGIAEARQVRYVGFRTEAGAKHGIASPRDGAVVRPDGPPVARRLERRLIDLSVEANVSTEPELLVDVPEIRAELLPRRIELAELPFPPQSLARILIDRAGRIDAGARITIPVPDAAEPASGLEHLDGHAEPTQPVEEIEAGEARAYNDDVEIFDLAFARPFCRRVYDGAILRRSRQAQLYLSELIGSICTGRRRFKGW